MAKVTIRQLLTHRAGTGDIGILGRDDAHNRATVRTIADMIRLNGNRAPAFPPGSKDDYSNYGFILLGAVIERVTHGGYYDYVRQHVFEPAGMTASGFPDRDHLGEVAVGYTSFFGGRTSQGRQYRHAALARLARWRWRGERERYATLLRCHAGRDAAFARHVQAGHKRWRDALVWDGLRRQFWP